MGAIVPCMGSNNRINFSLGDALFSRTQQRVLGLLYGNPDRSYYTKEIVRLAGVGTGTVHRELEKLTAVELLTFRKIGNQKHFQANQNSPIYSELHGIVIKTFGVADQVKIALAPFVDQINYAFIFGSVAKAKDRSSSDIDVLIVSSDVSYSQLYSVLTELETQLGRSINPTVFKQQEIKQKLKADNAFVKRIFKQAKIFLIGSEDDIGEAQ